MQLQEQHLATVQPQGWCVSSVDYPERFEMHTRAQISEDEYHKEKLLLLLVATRCHVVEQIQPQCDVAVFIGQGTTQKCTVVSWLVVDPQFCG